MLGLVWAAGDLSGFLAARAGAAARAGRFLLALAAAGIVATFAVAAWQQTGYWRNSETLWVRDLLYPNLVGRYDLGLALANDNRHSEAVEQYIEALAIDPNDRDTHHNLGLSYEALGRLDDAAGEFRWTLATIQEAVDAENKRAEELRLQDNLRGAGEHLQAALEKRKELVDANKNLARVLQRQDKDREALEHWRAALQEEPKDSVACLEIARVLASSPDAALRDGAAAVEAARQAVDLSKGEDPAALDARGAAYAEAGDFAQAILDARAAGELASERGEEKLAAEIQQRLQLYQAAKPYRRSRP